MRYLCGGSCGLFKYDIRTGVAKEINLPVSGNSLFECLDWNADRWLVHVTSWAVPTTTYDFDARKDFFAKEIPMRRSPMQVLPIWWQKRSKCRFTMAS